MSSRKGSRVRTLTTSQEKAILARLGQNESRTRLAEEFGVSRRTIMRLQNQEYPEPVADESIDEAAPDDAVRKKHKMLSLSEREKIIRKSSQGRFKLSVTQLPLIFFFCLEYD